MCVIQIDNRVICGIYRMIKCFGKYYVLVYHKTNTSCDDDFNWIFSNKQEKHFIAYWFVEIYLNESICEKKEKEEVKWQINCV